MSDKIDIRASLHTLEGMLRENRLIDLYELLQAMQEQEDNKFYGEQQND